jgi:4-diphosphocytidyl-2-C-methyl-D-erythritol kinase
MQEIAYAKINLALHVRERLPDGYHRIETVFAFAEDGDVLSVAPADALSLRLTGPFAADLTAEPGNLVLRAARALAAEAGVPARAALTLDKRLPVASGIGGGSADAAAALRLLSRFWGIEVDQGAMHRLAAGLGADVPACLASAAARGDGRGDALTPIDEGDFAGALLLLVNPRRSLSTSRVFAAWDGVDRGPLESWRAGRNDLEAPARAIEPEIGEVLASLADAGLARMSGSGATCFGLFDSVADRDRVVARLATESAGWWVMASRLRSPTGLHERSKDPQ